MTINLKNIKRLFVKNDRLKKVYDVKSGELAWKENEPLALYLGEIYSACYKDEKFYVIEKSSPSYVSCYNLSGNLNWTYKLPVTVGYTDSAITASTSIIFCSVAGNLYSFDLEGRLKASKNGYYTGKLISIDDDVILLQEKYAYRYDVSLNQLWYGTGGRFAAYNPDYGALFIATYGFGTTINYVDPISGKIDYQKEVHLDVNEGTPLPVGLATNSKGIYVLCLGYKSSTDRNKHFIIKHTFEGDPVYKTEMKSTEEGLNLWSDTVCEMESNIMYFVRGARTKGYANFVQAIDTTNGRMLWERNFETDNMGLLGGGYSSASEDSLFATVGDRSKVSSKPVTHFCTMVKITDEGEYVLK